MIQTGYLRIAATSLVNTQFILCLTNPDEGIFCLVGGKKKYNILFIFFFCQTHLRYFKDKLHRQVKSKKNPFNFWHSGGKN